jgi:hypothetical protein
LGIGQGPCGRRLGSLTTEGGEMRLRAWKTYGLGAGGMLVLVMAILLATGWGSAVAAQISSVFVTNDAAHPVPVHEQGTANVNVTSGNLSVGLPPVTGGGGSLLVVAGQPQTVPVATASAITIEFIGGASSVSLRDRDSIVADVGGAVADATNAPETVPLALTRPISFDHIVCFGLVGGICDVNWVGNTP